MIKKDKEDIEKPSIREGFFECVNIEQYYFKPSGGNYEKMFPEGIVLSLQRDK